MSTVSVSPRAGRPRRPAHLFLLATCLGAALVMSPAPAGAQVSSREVQAAVRNAATRDIRAFYEAREYRPLWIRGYGLGDEAYDLLELLETAHLDGLDPDEFDPDDIAEVIENARDGSPRDLARAEIHLSKAFADYVQASRRPRRIGMIYESEAVAPVVPTKAAALEAAANAPSLRQYLRGIGWMHPLYAPLRQALQDPYLNDANEKLVRLNLERVRAIPANPASRYVLVDAAAARLYMYENGRVRDSMPVVVGKPEMSTPMMAGFIRYAIMNPYWNVPTDLVKSKVAAGVISSGPSYLKAQRYDILSDWMDNASVVDPASIDWKRVAAGRQELRVRQLPGKGNSMGKVKFMFPNDLGIYLHDTPEKELMKKASRQFSSGCVRLEDASRLGRWLFKKPLAAPSADPEQRVELPEPVPVYITYLTAAPEGARIAYRPDVYHRDNAQMAELGIRTTGGRRGATSALLDPN